MTDASSSVLRRKTLSANSSDRSREKKGARVTVSEREDVNSVKNGKTKGVSTRKNSEHYKGV